MNPAVRAPGKRILLVEDDQTVRESIRLLLNIDRHKVTEAANGHEALQLFTGSRYDLVITDYLMPEMLGDELAQNIKNLEPAQPVLMVTAYMEKLVNAGKPADAVLAKPFSIDDLRAAMAVPIQNCGSPHAPTRDLSAHFSRAALLNRASATAKVVDEIVPRKRSMQPSAWGSPKQPPPQVG